MKNKKHSYLILSLVLNLILLFFISPVNRAKVKVTFLSLLGYSSNTTPSNFRDTVLVSEYKPKSFFESPDLRNEKLPSYPIIETHGHLGSFFKTNPKDVSKALDDLRIEYFISLNLKGGKDFLEISQSYNDPRIIHFTSFQWDLLTEKDGIEKMLSILREDFQKGARGVKLWKNFGLELKKANQERLTLDDPILEPLFREIEKQNKIVSIHTADPEAFFSPIDEENERYEELVRHPEWSFENEKFPKFKEIMDEREKMFKKYPKITFISLHFAEFPHNLSKAEDLLINNPNVNLDIAARIDELGRHPNATKNFFIKWQDRILFGMDGPPDKEKVAIYTRFMETEDEYFDYHPLNKPRKGLWKISGIGLPPTVLEKIYNGNAKRIYGLK
jgi:predicted TIM-barrel fold metal-dependent hydrolase